MQIGSQKPGIRVYGLLVWIKIKILELVDPRKLEPIDSKAASRLSSIPSMNPGCNATIHLPPPSLTVSGTPLHVYASDVRNVMTLYIYTGPDACVFTSCIALTFVRLLLYTWCMYDTVGCVSAATLDRVLILWSFSEATAHALKVRTGMWSFEGTLPTWLIVGRVKNDSKKNNQLSIYTLCNDGGM